MGQIASSTETRRQAGRRPGSVIFLFVLQAFLGIGAIGGGIALIIDPSGEMIGMPVSIMVRSPFPDFLVPGIVLLVVFGLLPLYVLYGLYKKPDWSFANRLSPIKGLHNAWTFSLYIGFGQIIWIMVETYICNAVGIIHLFYMSLGLLIQAVTLLPAVQRHFVLDEVPERR